MTDEAEQSPEMPRLPDDRKVDFEIKWDEKAPSIGSVAHFETILNGYEDLEYTLQWQYSEDGETWEDLEGATDVKLDQEITLENYEYFWRVAVNVTGFKAEITE